MNDCLIGDLGVAMMAMHLHGNGIALTVHDFQVENDLRFLVILFSNSF